MFNLVDSHDTARILDRSKENKDLAYLTYLYMFSFPGTPTIYYGGEIGITGKHDPDNRRCMIWDEDKQDLDFKARIKHLIHLRKSNDAFSSSHFSFLYHDDQKQIIAYEKKGTDKLAFVLNASELAQTVHISGLTGTNIESNDIIKESITLKPYGYVIIKR